MNQPTPIIVINGMGRPENPHPKWFHGQNGLPLSQSGIWEMFESEVKYHPCPSLANTEPGKTVMAYQVMQERNPNATNAFDWQDCVIDGYEPICRTGWEQRVIWRPVDVPIVEQKEEEGKPPCGSSEKSDQTEIRIGKYTDVCFDAENKLLIITDSSLSFFEFTLEEAHQLRIFLNTLTL